ncbi:hypothetical protein [Pseudomonas sp. NPDC099000]|uniref:hypothetical protein n=1 Tax=Pseudomonas sp. NPDC099000 TaxID=3364488 RepID=UPI00383BC392
MTDTPKFPDNPDHANGTCEECGEPCQVYGCRWCPDCYDAASAVVREASRAQRIPKAQTPAEWAASLSTPAYPSLPSEQPCPWQQAALVALGVAAQACPSTLVGLPVTADRGVPASTLFLLAARPGRTRAMFDALRLELDDVDAAP